MDIHEYPWMIRLLPQPSLSPPSSVERQEEFAGAVLLFYVVGPQVVLWISHKYDLFFALAPKVCGLGLGALSHVFGFRMFCIVDVPFSCLWPPCCVFDFPQIGFCLCWLHLGLWGRGGGFVACRARGVFLINCVRHASSHICLSQRLCKHGQRPAWHAHLSHTRCRNSGTCSSLKHK